MQVTIGIPSQGTWKDVMGLSLLRAMDALPHTVHLSAQRGPYLDVSREACVKEALAAKSDRLVFIDTDMAFQPDALTRLLAHGHDVIGGAYNEKRHPRVSTVKMVDGDRFGEGTFELPDAPFRCGAVGTGFLSINLKRLAACMAPPYFAYAVAFAADGAEFMGEDVAFCKRARAAGLDVWCDPTIPLAHFGDFAY